MDCLQCNNHVNFCYHILRHATQANTILGYGEFCSIECAMEKLKTANHGDSDYFEALSLIKQKYWSKEGIQTFYSPKEVREIRLTLLEPMEEVEVKKPRYEVMRASKKKRSTNDIIKNDFFTGKCEPIMTGKNLCSSK